MTGPLTSLSGQGMGYIVYLIFVSAIVIVHLLGMYVGKLQLLNFNLALYCRLSVALGVGYN